ncbi:hypothetical protein [Tropicibacter sp. S64]|uniref:hypothetical protein n=1 Tax=Tropicibacter sp. S64 TaxID=3415122 RepID=UPI003C7B8D51
MLDFFRDPTMATAAFAVALFAGFSGLSLLRGASGLIVIRRKLLVAVSALRCSAKTR